VNPFSGSSSAPALAVISAMITPAILILATGNLVASTLTRLGRITDRARVLIQLQRDYRMRKDVEGASGFDGLLRGYVRRAWLVERALSAYYLAIGLFVAASLAIAFDAVVHDALPWLASGFVVTGAILLLVGTLLIFLETSQAYNLLRNEINLVGPSDPAKG
jgi:hypothetical protein